MPNMTARKQILVLEPFYGGSHKVLLDTLCLDNNFRLVTLSAKKWHWRARCGALCMEPYLPEVITEKILLCSSVLSLTELIGLRPDLKDLKKIVYFHENQLVYPKRQMKERDVQYAYNQITTCLSADLVIFNSQYNKDSFLSGISNIIKLLPDYQPKHLQKRIEPKCKVLYFPIIFPKIIQCRRSTDILHIVWPHRWEFDKGPEDFFKVMFKLKEHGLKFKLSVLGETFCNNPVIFEEAKERLSSEIARFGHLSSKKEYFEALSSCHVVVSTAKHEFFGVAMLESTHCGCFPLVPNSLVYPEIYPKNCLYNSLEDLYKRLEIFCKIPQKAVEERKNLSLDLSKYDYKNLREEYTSLFQ